MFLYNQQVTDTLTESFIALARASGIPVVGVYETMPVPGSPEHAACAATCPTARSSRLISSAVPVASPAQHTRPTWYWRSR
ncbi:MAG TPA: hypothetical protein VKU77_29040 [Streptosporangiaceae bacterium]|nr:hypothetical protein [Streptosporangiaceae bacterium]